jgi:ribonuclease HI
VLRYGTHEQELHGGEPVTTNNRMEMMAAIRALESLKHPVTAHIHTDSTYLRNGITKWVHSWQRNGWQTAARTPVKNVELWQRLVAATERHDVQWFWVRGHSGHPGNERADGLACRGRDEARHGLAGRSTRRG